MNKKMLIGALLATLAAAPALAADVGVSVSVGQPGFYGRIDIGNAYPQPVLIYPQPVVIAPGPVAIVQQPIYLHVPPGHASNWGKHCGRYNACGQRVYFVQDSWYKQIYVPAHRSAGGYDHDHGDRDRGDRHYRKHGERGDHGDRGDRGHGRDHDKGRKNKHD